MGADIFLNYCCCPRSGEVFGVTGKICIRTLPRASFHVNLGAAWFGQKKFDRAVGEYARALKLDPVVLEERAKAGVTAQIASPEDHAKFYYMLAKIHAERGDVDNCLLCLKKAKRTDIEILRMSIRKKSSAGYGVTRGCPPPATR